MVRLGCPPELQCRVLLQNNYSSFCNNLLSQRCFPQQVPAYSPLTAAWIRIGVPVSMRTTDRDLMKTACRTDVGNQRVEAGAVVAVAVVDEVTMEAIDTVKENHAVSLQQEGEHRK